MQLKMKSVANALEVRRFPKYRCYRVKCVNRWNKIARLKGLAEVFFFVLQLLI